MFLSDALIEEKLAESQQAFLAWKKLSVKERGVHVKKLIPLLVEHQEELSLLVTESMGKLITESRREVERCKKFCEIIPGLAEQYFSNENIATDYSKSYITYQPLGIILGISPWNFPLWQVIRFALPNLLAGNAVLVKHAPNVFSCSKKLEEIFLQAGFPAGVFQDFPVDEKSIKKVIQDDRVQGVALTGSVKAGKAVAAIAGEALKKTVLELGGSDPFIVFPDADIEQVVNDACQARFMNAGQICVAGKRLIVHEDIADEFVKRLVKKVSTYQVGNPCDEKTNLASLARKDLCDELDQQVQVSIEQGAKVCVGAKKSTFSASAYEATVLDFVTETMPVFQQEVFGPVSCVTRFNTEEEALRLANNSAYGLGATVWTQDESRGERVALQIESGMVYVNSVLRSDMRLPFGGIKNSGNGRELGAVGFREFTNVKTVVVN